MGKFFSTRQEAIDWLVFNGWTQSHVGAWVKGKRQAVINALRGNNSVVCVDIRGVTACNN